MIEAENADAGLGMGGGFDDGEDVGGGAEADVPNNELAIDGGDAFREMELFDVEFAGFLDGADDGMEGFAFGAAAHAMHAVGEADQFVIGHSKEI